MKYNHKEHKEPSAAYGRNQSGKLGTHSENKLDQYPEGIASFSPGLVGLATYPG
jgi:hypothetical protein